MRDIEWMMAAIVGVDCTAGSEGVTQQPPFDRLNVALRLNQFVNRPGAGADVQKTSVAVRRHVDPNFLDMQGGSGCPDALLQDVIEHKRRIDLPRRFIDPCDLLSMTPLRMHQLGVGKNDTGLIRDGRSQPCIGFGKFHTFVCQADQTNEVLLNNDGSKNERLDVITLDEKPIDSWVLEWII